MYHNSPLLWKNLLQTGMAEDGWQWDWTALGVMKSGADITKRVRAELIAKTSGVWAGGGLAEAMCAIARDLGETIEVNNHVRVGQMLVKGQVVMDWTGPSRLILAFERPFLNLAAYAGGIATSTRALVDAVAAAWKGPKGEEPRVTPTRKTLPGYRDIAIHAVLAGGGFSHRVSLSGGVLIKENHISASGGIEPAMRGARGVAPHGLKIEIEVRDLAELKQALAASADVVLLDNFTPAQIGEAVRLIREENSHVRVEVSGGIDASNVADYVIEGVHVISSGGITHSARSIDLSLLVR